MDILQQIFEICIFPLLGVLTSALVVYINAKKNELINNNKNEIANKYTNMLAETISTCVLATNQTYVEALKQKGEFNLEAQADAFNKTLQAVLDILSDEAKEYLTQIYGDLNIYLAQKIEAEVNKTKK